MTGLCRKDADHWKTHQLGWYPYGSGWKTAKLWKIPQELDSGMYCYYIIMIGKVARMDRIQAQLT